MVASVLAKNTDERDFIILGDLNADGSYFDEEDASSPLRASRFQWVITDDMDTMTTTDWTYDRMVMTDATYSYEYVRDSAGAFYFDWAYAIKDQDLVEDVSNHYPVYAVFRTDLADDDR